ncbi:hypothetical protein ACPA9J_13570 [Pseudomonas aeruginosa]
MTRDLGNLPPNVCHPKFLAGTGQGAGQGAAGPESRRCWTRRRSRTLGMGAFYAVGQGSDQPPRLIVLQLQGGEERDKAPHVLVARHHLRHRRHPASSPGLGMDEMKFDSAAQPACSAPCARC